MKSYFLKEAVILHEYHNIAVDKLRITQLLTERGHFSPLFIRTILSYSPSKTYGEM